MEGRDENCATVSQLMVPSHISTLFGELPLFAGEDEKLYHTLFSRIAAVVDPQNDFEWFRLKDIVDHNWEIIRYRRLKSRLFSEKFILVLDGYAAQRRRSPPNRTSRLWG